MQIRFNETMKSFFGILILTILASAAYAQSTASPLAPPKVPPPSATGTSTKLKVGEKAPDFALPNGDGKLVTLSEYTQRTPVVLVFYRGFW
jgi:AhpC/TSA family protein